MFASVDGGTALTGLPPFLGNTPKHLVCMVVQRTTIYSISAAVHPSITGLSKCCCTIGG